MTWKEFAIYMDGFREDVNRIAYKVYIGVGVIVTVNAALGLWVALNV